MLVCASKDCILGHLLEPKPDKVLKHLKEHHHPILKETQNKLKQLILDLNLCPSRDLVLDMALLPAKAISKLPFVAGFHCTKCPYAVRSKSAVYTHFRERHGQGKNVKIKATLQLLFNNGGTNLTYLHIQEPVDQADVLAGMPQLFPKIEDEDLAIQAKVQACLDQQETLFNNAGLNTATAMHAMPTGNQQPWQREIQWVEYWHRKPGSVIGSLNADPAKWPSSQSPPNKFYHWVHHAAKKAAYKWMKQLTAAGKPSPRVGCVQCGGGACAACQMATWSRVR